MKFRTLFVRDFSQGICRVLIAAIFSSSVGSMGLAPASDGLIFGGNVAAAGTLPVEVLPEAVNFGRVVVGHKNSQAIRLSNSGKTSMTVTKAELIGHGYSVTGLSLPVTLAAGKSVTFTLSFQPGWAGNITGTLTVVCSQELLPTIINLDGVGITAALQLAPSPTSLNFGSVALGNKETRDVKLTNTGNVDVDIKTVSASGMGFAASGGTNVILAPAQSTNVAVSFDPKVAGSVGGRLSVESNAPAVTIGLSAEGSSSKRQHTVLLDWSLSTSAVEGYNVYRGTSSGGPYARLNGALEPGTSYADGTVASGKIYYYVVTAVGKDNVESSYSKPVSATIPTP